MIPSKHPPMHQWEMILFAGPGSWQRGTGRMLVFSECFPPGRMEGEKHQPSQHKSLGCWVEVVGSPLEGKMGSCFWLSVVGGGVLAPSAHRA